MSSVNRSSDPNLSQGGEFSRSRIPRSRIDRSQIPPSRNPVIFTFDIPSPTENPTLFETPRHRPRPAATMSAEKALVRDRRFHRVLRFELEEQTMFYGEERNSVRNLEVHVDSEGDVDQEDAEFILKRVANIKMEFDSHGTGNFNDTGNSMVSLLLDRCCTTNQTWLTTTRHSIGMFYDEKDRAIGSTSSCYLNTPFHRETMRDRIQCFVGHHSDEFRCGDSSCIDISRVVLDNNVQTVRTKKVKDDGNHPLTWTYGYDILKVRIEEERFLRIAKSPLKPMSFEIVDSDFPYEVGIRILVPEWEIPTVEDGVLRGREPFEGEFENTNLHTGEITGVGTNHIEHNINTYSGVSGAPVICVDRRPEFEPYRLKVIAIHGGGPLGIDSDTGAPFSFNVAFKTRSSHEKSFGDGNRNTCWLFDVSKVLRGIQQMLLSALHQPDRH